MALRRVESNAVVPSMSATLEYLQYVGNLELSTQFHEAELDYFGSHMYDSKTLDGSNDASVTGKRHCEWKPA